MESSQKIHIGTSGWHYEHWVGPFYPPDATKEGFLSYYARHFRTVEINSSFYRLPRRKTFEQWRDTVAPDFLFSVKANRFITHMKKLKEPEKTLSAFMERIEGLKNKLGPILFQLPPHWERDLERLEYFLASLPKGYRYAFEFRDPSWFHSQVYEALTKHGAAFCIFELAGLHSPKEVTAGFVYIRLHGPGDAYAGCYSREALAEWGNTVCQWAKEGKDIYCYLDNDEAGYAAQNAQQLQELVRRIRGT